MAIWESPGGRPIVDASGKIIECETCPCDDPPCETCTDVVNYYSQFSELLLSLAFQAGGFFCPAGNCDDLSGDYILDYLADPTPIDDAGGILGQQDVVWAYEFPEPVVISCGALTFRVTHIIGTVICAGGNEVRLVAWMRTIPAAAATPVTIIQQWRRVTHLSNPDVDCADAGVLASDSLSSTCIPDGDAIYEFSI